MNSRLQELQTLIAEDPTDPFLQYVYALELEKAGNVEKATRGLQQLLIATPEYLAAYYQLGRLLQADGRTEEAIEILRSGIVIAVNQKNRHTLAELRFLLSEISGEDE
jgi:tetratricopeptide (TPR) repeat protein